MSIKVASSIRISGDGSQILALSTPQKVDLTLAAFLNYSGVVPQYIYVMAEPLFTGDMTGGEYGACFKAYPTGTGVPGAGVLESDGFRLSGGEAIVVDVRGLTDVYFVRATSSSNPIVNVCPVEPIYE